MAKAKPRSAPHAVAPLLPASRADRWTALVLLLGGFLLYHRIEVFSGLEMQIGGGADPRLIHTVCEHWLQVFGGHADVASPHIFWPQQGTLGYTDAMFAHGALYALARCLGVEMFQAYNFMLLSIDALNLAATFALLRVGLRVRMPAAAFGAVVFALNSAKLSQIGHAQLQALFPLPIALLALILLARRPRLSWPTFALGAVFGGCIALEIWSSYYNGWFFCFWLLIAGILALAQRETRGTALATLRLHWPALLVALAVLDVALLPFARIYQPVAEQLGMRDYDEVRAMLPQPLSYFSMGEASLVWGWLPKVFPQFNALPTPWEHRMGIGLVPVLAFVAALAVTSRAVLRRNASVADRWLLLLIASALVFLLLPIRLGNDSLWRWFFDNFPGAGALRSVTRIMLVAALPLALIAAMLADRLLQRAQTSVWRTAWVSALAALAVFGIVEQTRKLPGHIPAEERARIAEIAGQITSRPCVAFVVKTTSTGPESEIDLQTMAMLAAMRTGVPTLNGYSGKYPYGWDLEKMRAPGYPDRIREWLMRNHESARICVATVK